MLATGFNRPRTDGLDGTFHAEYDAITRLPNPRQKKKLTKINLFVMRLSKTGQIGNSMCCLKCLYDIKFKLPIRGYEIDRIYYSATDGYIVEETLPSMLVRDDFHITINYKKGNGLKNIRKKLMA